MKSFVSISFLLLTVFSCKEEPQMNTLFSLKNATSGILFENNLSYSQDYNPYTYRNFYNGGGVSLGDINNDGLLDIYFTGNLVDNKLYLNQGNWKFKDITEQAKVACSNVWSTGSTFVDINHDGLLDIYVCKSGKPGGAKRHNELFINNGDLTFTEESAKYGLDIIGLSVQAAFFDYDKDGDLDCYLLNNSIKSVGGYDLIKDQRLIPSENGNKLLQNNNNKFVDVSSELNIYSSAIGFGLGITLADFNQDNWPDFFISNDFFEKDYLYLNNKGVNFTEEVETYFSSLSMGSMGADAADLNNDLLPDLMVTEMLPATLARQKSKTTYESWDKQALAQKNGYFNQYSRNVLQRNLGSDGFVEISRFSGVHATEWSWGTLIFDMDNDGFKDIFISNGIYKDLLDRDYLNYMSNDEKIKGMIINDSDALKKLIDLMPSKAIPNVAFKNLGDFNFKNASDSLGLNTPSFSNGSAYGDLDNDGDLDLVVNNVNMPSFVYENRTDTTRYKSLKIRFKGGVKNRHAIGAKIVAFYGNNKTSMWENYPSKGFQSSVAPEIIIGLGNHSIIDSLIVTWPNDTETILKNIKSNQTLELAQKDAQRTLKLKTSTQKSILKKVNPWFSFKHKENRFIDFKREQLLDKMTSNEGPALSTADLNNDGVVDFYIGGAKNQSGQLFISSKDGTYKSITAPFIADKNSEDTFSTFFDSDGDGDLDLYVCSGGKAFSKFDSNLQDRLYINEGNQTFVKSDKPLPFDKKISASVVTTSDYDLDGDIDIFVGERYNPENYGIPGSGYLLENKGENNYELNTQVSLENIGMITSAEWVDINKDGWPDLVIGGEWMPISIFINNNGTLKNETTSKGLNKTVGLWTTIKTVDIDNDGDMDILGGNIGKNSFYTSGTSMFINDFDSNGSSEQIICQKVGSKYYPILDKDELISQLPLLKKSLFYYKDYATANMSTIFSSELLNETTKLELDITSSTVFINNDGFFTPIELPAEVQYSNIYAMEAKDLNGDGHMDLLLGGNQELVKPQFGKLDASMGWAVFGGESNKKYSFNKVQSLGVKGQIRQLKIIPHQEKTYVAIALNNDFLSFYEIE